MKCGKLASRYLGPLLLSLQPISAAVCMSVCVVIADDMCLRTVCEGGRTRWPVLFSLTLSFPAFQRHNGEILTTASVKHLSHWRFVVSFQLDNVQRTDQDLYRCVTQSPKGSGVSNFAELVVKGKHTLLFVSYCAFLFPWFHDNLIFCSSLSLKIAACKLNKDWKLNWLQ